MARGVRCVFKYPVARLKSSQLPPPNVGVSIQLVTAGEERGAGTGGRVLGGIARLREKIEGGPQVSAQIGAGGKCSKGWLTVAGHRLACKRPAGPARRAKGLGRFRPKPP